LLRLLYGYCDDVKLELDSSVLIACYTDPYYQQQNYTSKVELFLQQGIGVKVSVDLISYSMLQYQVQWIINIAYVQRSLYNQAFLYCLNHAQYMFDAPLRLSEFICAHFFYCNQNMVQDLNKKSVGIDALIINCVE
jgi:hypothetical protein